MKEKIRPYYGELQGILPEISKSDDSNSTCIDLIKFFNGVRDNYDKIIIFSGDGDLSYVLRYLKEEYGKLAYIFTARNHLRKELVDCKKDGIVEEILFAEDFEYRLNKNRFRI
ncbi:MAG: NYN domain-containing protein [bacterium]